MYVLCMYVLNCAHAFAKASLLHLFLFFFIREAAAPGDRSSKTFGVTANVSTVATAVPLESAQQPVAAIRSALRTGIHSDAAQAAPPSLVGRKVMAKWTDKRFYPGRIAGVRGKRYVAYLEDACCDGQRKHFSIHKKIGEDGGLCWWEGKRLCCHLLALTPA